MKILKVSQYQTDQVFHQRPQNKIFTRDKTSHMNKFGAFKRALIAKSDLSNKHKTSNRLTIKAQHL